MCVCVCECLPVSCALLPAVRRLQSAGPCGTHLTGEQRSVYMAHERRGRASVSLENRQGGRQAGRWAASKM